MQSLITMACGLRQLACLVLPDFTAIIDRSIRHEADSRGQEMNLTFHQVQIFMCQFLHVVNHGAGIIFLV